jgi:predicted  nucleic acid-binding Zn-ribbon protein
VHGCQSVLARSADFSSRTCRPAWSVRAGYIDLSKRRVSSEDIEKCEEKYEKGKLVNSVLTHVAGKLEMDIEELYEKVAWPLGTKFGHAYDAFKLSIRCGCPSGGIRLCALAHADRCSSLVTFSWLDS